MRNGYILLHRKSITPDDWKNARRTLAWIDFLTLVNYEDSIVNASYGFLASRWRVSKNTVYLWINYWITERRVERLAERNTERNTERFFVVNYAKYQQPTERLAERSTERLAERSTEQRNKVIRNKSKETNKSVEKTPPSEAQLFFGTKEKKDEILEYLVGKGFEEKYAKNQMCQFIDYWTEPNQDGTKLRWKDQKHFGLKRRLATWFIQASKFSQK